MYRCTMNDMYYLGLCNTVDTVVMHNTGEYDY